jgi:hypothetical protein
MFLWRFLPYRKFLDQRFRLCVADKPDAENKKIRKPTARFWIEQDAKEEQAPAESETPQSTSKAVFLVWIYISVRGTPKFFA